ncbi:MAG: TusE/DsrC/DsvC family sulfur relay protein [Desulfobulbus sp.]|jgi:tRNA 2-thiouridine synthesizing protein E|nr:TusE/DsrC/DsvC family sulfur relay protein [Desulfobulbus sp.]
MSEFSYNATTYPVDGQGFLLNARLWDENFAEGVARECGIRELTSEHWDLINHLRELYATWGACPTIFALCRTNGLRPQEMKQLFPAGYHRGLCRIAGVHYRSQEQTDETGDQQISAGDKYYLIDVRGFLVDPDSWDRDYAVHRALESRIQGGRLTDSHWRVIDSLRATFAQENRIPTVCEACEACGLDFDAFEALFPDGYHRGAVKIAGLRFVQ